MCTFLTSLSRVVGAFVSSYSLLHFLVPFGDSNKIKDHNRCIFYQHIFPCCPSIVVCTIGSIAFFYFLLVLLSIDLKVEG